MPDGTKGQHQPAIAEAESGTCQAVPQHPQAHQDLGLKMGLVSEPPVVEVIPPAGQVGALTSKGKDQD